jgi:N-acetylneuraminic acid mutarotase
VVDNKLWIFGGRVKVKKSTFFDSEGSGVQYRNDIHCYDPVTNEWYRYEPRGIGPSARSLHTAVVVGRKIYIFGGANSSGSRNDSSGFCDLYELDIDCMTWTECETQGTPPSPCYGHTATYIGNDKILFFGGKGYKVLNQINILDIRTMTWKQYAFAGNTLKERWGHSATLHDTRILIYGGRNDEGYFNTIDTINYANQLIELKPEEQAKENLKRKQDEKNRAREFVGDLQTQIGTLQSTLQQMGDQFISQRKTLTETRNTLLAIKQENDRLKRIIAEIKATSPPSIPSF